MTHPEDTTVMYEVNGPAVQFVIDPSTDTTPEQRHTATVIGGAADFLAAARVLDRLDRMPVGESPIERADQLAAERQGDES